MSGEPAPVTNSRRNRACLLCSILMPSSDFRKLGCPNCDEILQMKGSSDKVTTCTSAQFDGIIGVMKEGSWVSKWQRTDKYVPGVYAVKVFGKLPDEVIEELTERGYTYHRRDAIGDDYVE